MTNIGDTGHVTDGHNVLALLINGEAQRFGLSASLKEDHAEGDPGHVEAHNLMRAKIIEIANSAGITLPTPFPDEAHLGDLGHVADHDAMAAALHVIAAAPAWNDATGGTVTTVENYNGTGERWRVHTFASSGTLDVSIAAQPFRVLVVGGSGGGGSGFDGALGYGGGGGGAGGFREVMSHRLTAKAYTVTVGGQGATMTGLGTGSGGGGGQSSIDTLTADGGAGGNATWHANNSVGGASGAPTSHPGGSANGSNWAGGGGGAGGGGNKGTGGPGLPSTITGTSVVYAQGGGGGGSGWEHGHAGSPGTVIVAYRIG